MCCLICSVYALAGGVAGVLAYGLVDRVVAKPSPYKKVEEYTLVMCVCVFGGGYM